MPDVAAAVDRALVDPSCRGTVIEVVTQTMTFNELAAGPEADLGPGRQAKAALVMDGYDLTP